MVRGPQRSSRRRPSEFSISWQTVNSSRGESDVRTTAAALRYAACPGRPAHGRRFPKAALPQNFNVRMAFKSRHGLAQQSRRIAKVRSESEQACGHGLFANKLINNTLSRLAFPSRQARWMPSRWAASVRVMPRTPARASNLRRPRRVRPCSQL